MPAVISSFSCGKWADTSRNEDRVAVAAPFFAIFDGGTAKHDFAGTSPGLLAALAMGEALSVLQPTASAREAADLLTSRISLLQRVDEPRPFVSALIYSDVRREVWIVGDGWVMLDEQVHRFGHEIESRAAAARAAYITVSLETMSVEALRRNDVGREMILPLLKVEGNLANVDRPDPLCFGRLDGRRVPERFLHCLPVALATRRLVLASDGYPRLLDSLDATEKALRERIRSDPLMIGDPPMTKGVSVGQVSYDDRVWLELDVSSGTAPGAPRSISRTRSSTRRRH